MKKPFFISVPKKNSRTTLKVIRLYNFHPLPYYVEEVGYHRRLTNLQVNYELSHGNRRTWLYPASSFLNEAFRGIRCIAVFSYVLNDIPNT